MSVTAVQISERRQKVKTTVSDESIKMRKFISMTMTMLKIGFIGFGGGSALIPVIDVLEETITEMFFHGTISFNDEVYITNIRHKNALIQAVESLKLVKQSVENGMPEDFYSIDLMDAYEALGSITGETIGEDLINEIFSKFCMGK